MDRRPGARTTHADAVDAATDILGELGRRGNQLVHIAGDLDANLVEHPMVVGDVVLLEAPRNAPLLGVCRTQFAARLAVPGAGILDAGQEVIPGIFRVGLGRILDPFVEIGDPAGRAIGPGHVGAGHEGVVFRRACRKRCGYLVEIDVFREHVINDVHAGQLLEILEVGDHRIGIGMLVEQELDGLALVRLPIEIGGKCTGLSEVEQRAGRTGGKAHGAEPSDQATAIDLSAQERVDQVFLFLIHVLFSSTG